MQRRKRCSTQSLIFAVLAISLFSRRLFAVPCCFHCWELEFVLLHVNASASKGYAFRFEAQALFDGGVSAQFYFAAGAQYPLPWQVK
jgi:hypothetical protein